MSRDGDSYAAVSIAPVESDVELFRVIEVETTGGVSLCGADQTSFVALSRHGDRSQLVLMAFTGHDPPGPDAAQTRLCGVFGYATPSGPRVEGVVLR